MKHFVQKSNLLLNHERLGIQSNEHFKKPKEFVSSEVFTEAAPYSKFRISIDPKDPFSDLSHGSSDTQDTFFFLVILL